MNQEKVSKLIDEAMAVNEDKRMLREELELIADIHYEYYKGGNTLEIGAYKGMTSYLLAGLMYHSNVPNSQAPECNHYVVDLFELIGDTEWHYETHTRDMLLDNLGMYKDLVVAKQSNSLSFEAIAHLFGRKYDFVFIDGDHRYPTVMMELAMCDFLTDNIFGHDYGHPGVTQSVDEFCKHRGYTVEKFKQHLGMFKIIKPTA